MTASLFNCGNAHEQEPGERRRNGHGRDAAAQAVKTSGFDINLDFLRHVISGSLAFVSLIHTCRDCPDFSNNAHHVGSLPTQLVAV